MAFCFWAESLGVRVRLTTVDRLKDFGISAEFFVVGLPVFAGAAGLHP